METLPLPELSKGEYGEYSTHYTPYYENIVQVLDGKAEPAVTPEQALRVMKLVDTIFRCAEQGHGEACRI
jgi:predicted dehydrogenase